MSDEIASLLGQFGNHIRNFAFDKAKETAEEFRVLKCPPSPSLSGAHRDSSAANYQQGEEQFAWQTLIQCLPNLAAAEKGYMTLSFMLSKGFLRKESPLRANYTNIRQELTKISETLLCEVPKMTSAPQTVAEHLALQLKRFVDARLDLITLYERLATPGMPPGGGKIPTFDDSVVSYIDELLQNYDSAFTHPLISGIVANLLSEWEILSNLLKCHAKLTQLRFMDSLVHLKNASAVLKHLSRTATPETDAQGSGWFGFSASSKAPVLPPLFSWHRRYCDSLLSKFSLYFHDSLLKQTTPQEMRSQLSKTPENYVHRIAVFHRRHDAAFICLILNSEGLDHVQWQGYRHPDHKMEPLKGLESYPVIFSFPTGHEKPANLLPSAVMIINEQSVKLSSFDTVSSVFDDTKDFTYFICRVEGQLYLLITFKGRRSERDSNVLSFMHELCVDLRCVKVFTMDRSARFLK